MKRVAFLSFDWDYEITSRYYLGLQAYLEGRDDIQLVIFSAFGHYYASFEPEMRTFEVFSLCEVESFDGFLIQGNRTWPPELRQQFVNKALSHNKPVVSINYTLDGAYYVGTDNYEAMHGLVEKVLKDCEIKKPIYINGLATSVEAQERARAYKDACAEFGIRDARFHQGNWQIEVGVAAAHKLLEHREDLPDAAFCCNDDLAVGLLETLQEHGVQVPEDIVISGFDNREISMRTNPRITTVDRDYFTIAQTAMRTLEQSLDGMNPPKRAYSPIRYVLGGSCGYQTNYEEKAMSDVYTLDNSLKHFYEILSLFQSTVMSADSLEVILRVSEKYAKELECNNVYLSVSDRYLRSDYDHGADSYGPVMHLMAYTGKDYRGKCDEKHIYSSYLTRHLLPPEIALSKPLYVVLPLRHNEACIGVAVTEGVSSAMRHGFLTFFLTLLAGSMESVQKKEQLRIANARLDNLYVHDQLTGLFNRFGLDRFGTIAYEHLLRDFGAAHFIFVDIDDMKGINDNGGHEMGDLAIRDTAEIIRRATRDENAFSMRYGGDEFLLICRRNLISKLERELEAERNNMQYPYLLSLSMGACLVQKEEQLSLMEAIEQADRQMYRNKRAHKEDH